MEDGGRSTRSMRGLRKKYRGVGEGLQRDLDGGRSTEGGSMNE